MKKVTFEATYLIGKGLEKTEHTSIIHEFTDASDAAIRERAYALNWKIISIETNGRSL